jgi:acyl-coenzyme A synthetase/AMP-(fatty) acid ligase
VVCAEPPDRAAMLAHIEDRLASYKRPAELHFVAALPRNALGKTQKHLLTQLR